MAMHHPIVAHVESESLVAGLRRGEPQAISALFDRHGRQVHRLLLHLLGAEPDVPDLVHDVFVTAIERIRDLERPASLPSWLSGMAVLTAKSFIRRRRRFWRWPAKRPSNFRPAPAPGPDVGTALRLAYKVLDRLPTDERIVFVLRVVDRLGIDEIASMTGTSASTVKRRLKRADDRFRELAGAHPLLWDWLDR